MTIHIEQLRYVHLGSRDPGAAAEQVVALLGLQEAWRGDGDIALRSDARACTLAYAQAPLSRQSIGLEVRDTDTLAHAAQVLEAQGITARRDDALAARRQVKALLAFTTPGGLAIELVVRPLHKGWRFHASRDSGMTGLSAVAIRTPQIARDEALWREVFGLRVADWIGDAVYLGLDSAVDRAHHRLSLHPSTGSGVLAVEFGVESCDKVMQQFYLLRDQGLPIRHGPGRRPTSEQVFLSFDGPDDVIYSVVAEGRNLGADDRPRQFAVAPESYCGWGSDCSIAEYLSQAVDVQGNARTRPQLREVGKP